MERRPGSTGWSSTSLREAHPYYWNTDGQGHWVLTRYEDIREAFQDPETFSNHSIVATDPDPAYRFLPSHLDPPRAHGVPAPAQQVVLPGLGGHACGRTSSSRLGRPSSRSSTAAVATSWTPSGTSSRSPRFLAAMGLPLDDADFFVSRVRRMSGALSDPTADKSDAMAAWWEIVGVLAATGRPSAGAAPGPRRRPHHATSVGAPSTTSRCPTRTCSTSPSRSRSAASTRPRARWAGACTTSPRTPTDRARLVASPELVPDAVEEFLRAYPIVSMARKVTKDVEFHGCPMKQGDMVLLSIQSATRDPRVFPDADQVVIDRRPNRHIAFGASAHRCLGSHLARAELQIAIEEWHRLHPGLHPRRRRDRRSRGVGRPRCSSLPLRLGDDETRPVRVPRADVARRRPRACSPSSATTPRCSPAARASCR